MAALRQPWSARRRRPRFVAGSLALLAFLLVYPAIQWYLRLPASPASSPATT